MKAVVLITLSRFNLLSQIKDSTSRSTATRNYRIIPETASSQTVQCTAHHCVAITLATASSSSSTWLKRRVAWWNRQPTKLHRFALALIFGLRSNRLISLMLHTLCLLRPRVVGTVVWLQWHRHYLSIIAKTCVICVVSCHFIVIMQCWCEFTTKVDSTGFNYRIRCFGLRVGILVK